MVSIWGWNNPLILTSYDIQVALPKKHGPKSTNGFSLASNFIPKKRNSTFDYNLTIRITSDFVAHLAWYFRISPRKTRKSNHQTSRDQSFHLLNEGVFQQFLRGHKLYDTNPKLKMHCIFFRRKSLKILPYLLCLYQVWFLPPENTWKFNVMSNLMIRVKGMKN